MTSNIASQTNSLGDYELVRANLREHNETILQLWRGGLSHAGRPMAKMDWFYLGNPIEQPAVFLLRCRGEFVGVAVIASRRFSRAGMQFNAGFVFDFVLSPEHRGLFPAIFVQRGVLKHAANEYAIVFGIPNQKSRPVLERVGFRKIGDKVRYVRVIRSARILSRHLPVWLCTLVCPIIDFSRDFSQKCLQRLLPRAQANWQPRADESFDDLWQAQQQSDQFIGTRDMAFLNWRFANCPLHEYRFFVVRSTHDNGLLAYAVCRVDQGNLHVDDFLSAPGNPAGLKQLWKTLAIAAFREGYDTISVTYFCAAHRDFVSPSGFVARDGEPVLASEIHATWTEAVDGAWHITPADEDI